MSGEQEGMLMHITEITIVLLSIIALWVEIDNGVGGLPVSFLLYFLFVRT